MVTASYSMKLVCDFCGDLTPNTLDVSGNSASCCHQKIRSHGWRVIGVDNKHRKALCPKCYVNADGKTGLEPFPMEVPHA